MCSDDELLNICHSFVKSDPETFHKSISLPFHSSCSISLVTDEEITHFYSSAGELVIHCKKEAAFFVAPPFTTSKYCHILSRLELPAK